MVALKTNRQAMFVRVADLISKQLEPVSHTMSTTWSIIGMEQFENGFDATISITRVTNLRFFADFPEELDYLFKRVKDGSSKKVLDEVIGSSRVVGGLANVSGAVGLIKLHIVESPNLRNQFVVESVETKMNDIYRLQVTTHSYGPGTIGKIHTDFSVGNILSILTEYYLEDISNAYKDVFTESRFKGQSFLCHGNIQLNAKVREAAVDYIKKFDSCLHMLDDIASNCRRLVDVVPAKKLSEDGESVSLNSLSEMVDGMSKSLGRIGDFTVNAAEDVVRRIDHKMLQNALRRSQVNESVEIQDVIIRLQARMSVYKDDVESNGLNGGRESNGYERHVQSLQYVYSYIENDIIPAIEVLQCALKLLLVEDSE